MSQERHVVRKHDGTWDVKKPHARRASANKPTQAEAEARAKEILSKLGGGEAVIHDRHSRIRDKDTVAPAHDPNPPKDRRH